jgi:hypothetical protein
MVSRGIQLGCKLAITQSFLVCMLISSKCAKVSGLVRVGSNACSHAISEGGVRKAVVYGEVCQAM